MLLERLSVENYGVYAGRSTFDLSTSPEKPIVLIGGLNGAGKSTIFECIMVALYGKTYLGRRTTKKEYMEFAASRVHKHKGKRADSTSVEVAFRFYHNGSEDEYAVNRSWAVNGASVLETFSVYKNGKPMADVDESQWQSFVEGLIPLGIAKLFFFDGEKIVKITNWDRHNNVEIKSSLDTLLGTELIRQLHSDLELYLIRRTGKKRNSDTVSQKYEQMNREKNVLLSEIDALTMERNRKENIIHEIELQISSKEQKVLGVGGGYAGIREKLLMQRAVLEEKLRNQNKGITDELSDDAPLYLVPALLERIGKQVESDVDIMRQEASAHVAKEKMHEIRKEVVSAKFWPAGTDVESASSAILTLLDRMFEEPQRNVLFDVTHSEAAWITQKIAKIQEGYGSLYHKIKEYDKTMTVFEKIGVELARIPRDDEIGPQISDINTMHEEMGILKAELAHIDQNVSSKRAYCKILQNKIKDSINQIHKDTATDSGMRLASKMQDALDLYSAGLMEKKMTQLESNLLDIARLLLHKKLLHHIEIDRETFEIKAYGTDDSLIPGGLLSMGERQIVGTALLWALARTSGRPLPFVIDTPIGRLDGEHLANLTDRFYPFASHQTILLSTDREIGHKEYERLCGYISRSYRITHDETKSATSVSEGYFVEERQVA